MQGRTGTIVGIGLTVVAFFIGLYGIVILIGVGEGSNNALTAFATVSFPFALLAAFFSWLAPRAKWAIAVAMFAPVTLLSLASAWSSGFMLLGALWTAGLTCAGAYLGARFRSSRFGSPQPPTS